jgi:hypothetical protein
LNATPEAQDGRNKENDREYNEDEKPNMWQWIRNIFGKSAVWTAIFTGLLTLFTFFLYQVSNRTNETAVATQRAFITSTGVGAVSKVTDVDGKKIAGYTFNVAWVNSGSTPAKTVTMQNNLAVWPSVPDSGMDFNSLPQAEKKSFVFGPKQGTALAAGSVSLSDLESALAGRAHVFAWGWVVYHDIFPDTPTRLTEYCIDVLNPRWSKSDHSESSGDVMVDTPPCKVHNCYDDECPDYKKRTEQ